MCECSKGAVEGVPLRMKFRHGSSAANAPIDSGEQPLHEHSTHRLEAFSDIVIGFSLAQLGLSLVIPAHAIEFLTRPAGIFAFVVTFIVVVRFWWFNFVLFKQYFRPNRTMIALNFIALGSLILQVFSLQLYLHFGPLQEGAVASRIYFAFFALSYGMQGVMLALGMRYRWGALSHRLRHAGVSALLRRFGIVFGAVLGNVFANNHLAKVMTEVGNQTTVVANLPSGLLVGTLFGALAGALASWFVPRFFRSPTTQRELAG